MKLWYVDWDDLSSVWSSKAKALEFLQNEAKRINATLTLIEEEPNWFWMNLQYEDGEIIEITCGECVVDESPYGKIEG